MDRNQKSEIVSALNAQLAEVGVVVVTRNLGMTVAQSTVLRQKMRDAGASYKVTKNRLVKIALEGTDYTGISDLLAGPVGLASSVDPVAAAKVAVDFAKTNDKLVARLVSLGGEVLPGSDLEKVASLPTREQALSIMLGTLKAPIEKLVRTLVAPHTKLVRTVVAIRDAKQATSG
jgi:large subunit ribosomal protein L10